MRGHILIVEDDPLVSMMLEGYLDALGCDVAGCVETVADAVFRITGGSIDAAILDVHLANGETSEPVAAVLNAACIPYIVTTGGFNNNVEAAYKDAPILRKPFTMTSLSQALAKISLD
ncbi:response regulator [Sphingopyxis panaciterrae]